MLLKKLTANLLIAILLVSCAPAATAHSPTPAIEVMATAISTSTATSTPAPTPTATIPPTPVTYIEGLDHIPMPDSAFIEDVVSENYLRVMGLTREQVKLTYAQRASFVAMLDKTKGVPLAVYADGKWQKSSLKFFGN
ncbi:MAG: hypothetical protein WCK35_12845, partial [Chloroflexota bacterium]